MLRHPGLCRKLSSLQPCKAVGHWSCQKVCRELSRSLTLLNVCQQTVTVRIRALSYTLGSASVYLCT